MTALYIILAILVVIVLLLVSRIKINVSYKYGELYADADYLIINFLLVPEFNKEKFENDIRSGKKKKIYKIKLGRGPKGENPLIPIAKDFISRLEFNLSDNAHLVKEAVLLILNKLGWILKRITITTLNADISVSSPDAARTAISYGNYNSAVFSALAIIKSYIKVKDDNIKITPDFLKEKTEFSIDLVVKAHLFTAIILLISLVIEKKKLYNEIESIKEKYE
jgi:hypothetical protein